MSDDRSLKSVFSCYTYMCHSIVPTTYSYSYLPNVFHLFFERNIQYWNFGFKRYWGAIANKIGCNVLCMNIHLKARIWICLFEPAAFSIEELFLNNLHVFTRNWGNLFEKFKIRSSHEYESFFLCSLPILCASWFFFQIRGAKNKQKIFNKTYDPYKIFKLHWTTNSIGRPITVGACHVQTNSTQN